MLTGLVPQRSYWELRARWRPTAAIIGVDDERVHIESGRDCVAVIERLCGLDPGWTTLGIGVGGGRIEHWLAPRVRACCGVDISLGMVRKARSTVARPNVLFVPGSGRDLACFRTATVDLVYSFIVFQHMGDAQVRSYFRDTARVLVPDGRFLFQIATDTERRRRFVPFRDRHPYAIRWRDIREVCAWLGESGLVVRHLLRNDGAEVTVEEAAAWREESMIVLAERAAVAGGQARG